MIQTAIAYCGSAPTPAELFARWNFDPVVMIGLAGAALWAWRGERRAALAGVVVLALLFLSPLCAATSALFSARVVHHVLLVAVAAPLLALPSSASLSVSKDCPSSGPRPGRAGLRQAQPGRGWEFSLGPGAALALHAATFWGWHLPALYGWALSSTPGYWLMQLTLLGTATLFWQAVLRGERAAGMVALVAAVAQMGLLGAILTFAPRPLYAAHLLTTEPWGLSPLADQQLAGLLMWVPALVPYAIAFALLARRAVRDIEGAAG